MIAELENQVAAQVREVNADDLRPKVVVTHGESVDDALLRIAQEAGVEFIVVGSFRTFKRLPIRHKCRAGVRHPNCSVLLAADLS